MKASLQLSMKQQLKMTPQLQQAIRLLQLSTLDLQHEIQDAVESNPLLEASEEQEDRFETREEEKSEQNLTEPEFQWSEIYTASKSGSNFDKADYNLENIYASTINLQDHLRWQLNLSPMTDKDRVIGTSLIDAIAEDGYLNQSIADIQTSLNNLSLDIDEDEIEAMRHRIQRFDPVGCACYSLSECLLLQLESLNLPKALSQPTARIIREDLTALAQKNSEYLQKKYQIDHSKLKVIIHTIQDLHPKPGYLIQAITPEYIIPDVFIKKVRGQWQVQLNERILPKVSINQQYAALMNNKGTAKDSAYIKHNLQEAQWFLKGIESRQETLYKVTKAILQFQQAFFEGGEKAMKPLVLQDIAHALGMHESSISRVTTQKFVHTPQGVFELKYFFSSAVGQEDARCSSTAVKALIKECVNTENKKKPLSDQALVKLLNDKGMPVARRTVSKYREEMGIPPSRERKVFSE